MQVMLDNEQWTVNDNTSLMEILAQVSDKTFAQNRVVIALQVGERRMTDRDLTPTQLGRIGAGMGPVRATTQSMTQIIDGGDASMQRFAGLLKSDALGLVQAIRAGQPPAGLLDACMVGPARRLSGMRGSQGVASFSRHFPAISGSLGGPFIGSSDSGRLGGRG